MKRRTEVWEKWINAELLFHCHKNCDCIGSQETGPGLLGVSMGSQHGHRHGPGEGAWIFILFLAFINLTAFDEKN